MGIPYSTQSHFYHASGLVSATWPVHQDQKVHLLHELQASSDQPLKNTRILATVQRKQNGKRFKNYRQEVKILKKKSEPLFPSPKHQLGIMHKTNFCYFFFKTVQTPETEDIAGQIYYQYYMQKVILFILQGTIDQMDN